MGVSFLHELTWRGLLHQRTAEAELETHLSHPGRVGYCGFDPTSDSLTIGNLMPLMMMRHFQRAGHVPVVLMGGGTGLIGDPSGKDVERSLQTREQVEANVASQRKIFESLLDFDAGCANRAVLVNNLDWLEPLGFLEVLRDVGKYFSVNAMIQKDSVKDRLENREQGISYTEFSYMLLQAYDFMHLRNEINCTVQIAGSDQYGNIVSGIDLIRRAMIDTPSDVARGYGVTGPLVTKSDGTKFGKSESGAVWLSPDRTSPYAFYQFWLNAADADVPTYLRFFTELSQEEIKSVEASHDQSPHERQAQRLLADTVTAMVHSSDDALRAREASAALFSGEVESLPADLLAEVIADVPHSDHDKSSLSGGAALVDVLVSTTLASSKREAREFLKSGSVAVNGSRIEAGDEAIDATVDATNLLHGTTILLKRGKKKWHATTWE
jgi:tyrosyl-tRNA synthetase